MTSRAPQIRVFPRAYFLQLEGGFLAGLALGFVPFGGVGHQVLDATHVLPHGSANARLGLAVGQIVGGLALVVGGATGELLGGAVSVSGIGALAGVPAMAVSATLITGGVGNIAAGIQGLMTTGSGGGGPPKAAPAARGGAPGSRPSQPFTKAGKDEVWKRNTSKYGGMNKCENCGAKVTKPQQHTKGVTPPGNEGHVDHSTARVKGGSGTPDNGQVLCRDCNLEKGAQ